MFSFQVQNLVGSSGSDEEEEVVADGLVSRVNRRKIVPLLAKVGDLVLSVCICRAALAAYTALKAVDGNALIVCGIRGVWHFSTHWISIENLSAF